MSARKVIGRDPQTGNVISLAIDAGVISNIEACHEETDLFLSAGFVDLQVNGHSGFDINAPQITQETVINLVGAMLACGVTSFAPTIITASEEKICHALSVIAAARQNDRRAAACIPFVHVEGPHISPLDGYRGAHALDAVRPPSVAEFARWQDACGGLVGLVTLSPHYAESAKYIEVLVQKGVHVAIGHTHASAEQIHQAVDAGARLSTHLGNGIAQQISRHDNPMWPQLADNRLTAGLIADGHHLPADVLKVMLSVKGVARSILVSDAVALAGMPAGIYETPVGGRVELYEDNRLCVFGSQLLAGSTTSLPQCISTVVHIAGVPLYEALRMATEIPGQFVGGRGQLACGARADLVRFRWQNKIIVEDVWIAGEKVYTCSNVAV